jgi:hypothetical protein
MPYYVCPRCGGTQGFGQMVQQWSTEYAFPDDTPRNSVSDELVYFCSSCKIVQMDRFSTKEENERTVKTIKKVVAGVALLVVIGFINNSFFGRQSSFPWPPKNISLMGVNTDVKISDFHSSENPDFLIRFNPSAECSWGISCAEVQYISRYKCSSVHMAVKFSNSANGQSEIIQSQDSDGTEGVQKDSGGYFVFARSLRVQASAGNLDVAQLESIKCSN